MNKLLKQQKKEAEEERIFLEAYERSYDEYEKIRKNAEKKFYEAHKKFCESQKNAQNKLVEEQNKLVEEQNKLAEEKKKLAEEQKKNETSPSKTETKDIEKKKKVSSKKSSNNERVLAICFNIDGGALEAIFFKNEDLSPSEEIFFEEWNDIVFNDDTGKSETIYNLFAEIVTIKAFNKDVIQDYIDKIEDSKINESLCKEIFNHQSKWKMENESFFDLAEKINSKSSRVFIFYC